MKINTTAKSRKKLIIPLAVVLLLATGGYAAAASINNLWPFAHSSQTEENDPQAAEPEVSDINDTEEASEENPEATPRPQTSSNDEPSKQLTPGNTENPDIKPVKPTISHATQNGDSIEVVATFNTTANGTCRLTLSKPGEQNINRESPITVGPSYYICGFTVGDVSGAGWTASVTHAYNDRLSDLVSKKVE